ncbi:orm1 [Pungitius sinensis]
MLLALCAIPLLCLMSASRAAPRPCDDSAWLADRLDPSHLVGRWAMVAGSLSHLPFLERFKQRDSAYVNFSNSTSETAVSYSGSIRQNGTCLYRYFNISLAGGRFAYEGTPPSNLTTSFVRASCPDCMLMHVDRESGKWQHLYLFSRRRELEQKELEKFRAQVECLNMLPPVVMDPTKELCPEEQTPN